MSKTLFTSKGVAVSIGRKLGHGGEGSVYELPSLFGQVAKLYHKAPDTEKQSKLAFMVATADAQLLQYVAWPQETLHARQGGPVIGFLMPKVDGKAPIHMVYSPAHRRQDYPNAAWDFLLFVARNIAASFETLHTHGHIVGDVNQNSFMVGRDSKVVLIDSDSFQINTRGTIHRCKVGVSHFTPPELQSLSSFDDFTRTVNHDNFGLALLIFHTLFGGRHPYSGVPLKKGVGDALEADIKAFRYAYARDAQSRGITPPPHSIPVSILPDAVESMFHQAFTEKGVSNTRPTASQWVTRLDEIRCRLSSCTATKMHVYPAHLPKCPWCALEQQGVAYFIDLGTTFTQTSTGFVLTQVWAQIEAVPAPPAVSIPTPATFSVEGRPLPPGITGEVAVVFFRVVVVVIAITIAVTVPGLWFLAMLGGIAGWNMAGNVGSSERNTERTKRRDALNSASQAFNKLAAQAKADAGPEGFNSKKEGFRRLRVELESLPEQEKRELDHLHATARDRQKQKYLEMFFIDDATISGVGPARKAALRSFGIETAADVTLFGVRQVRGFGESLTNAVLKWRSQCERKFQFDPAKALTTADRNAIRARLGARKVAIERQLADAPRQLKNFRQAAAGNLSALMPQLEEAARSVAQAQADLAKM